MYVHTYICDFSVYPLTPLCIGMLRLPCIRCFMCMFPPYVFLSSAYPSKSICPFACIYFPCVGYGWIAADGLLVSYLVAVELLLWAGRGGLAADFSVRVGYCGLVVVDQSLWVCSRG